MRVSLRQLQIFLAVAAEMSYTRAAESLNLTQPAVFTQVRQLEEHLGSELIERIGKKLYLTAAGKVVLDSARDVLGSVDRLEMRLADLMGMVRGRLRVAVVSTAKYDIPVHLGTFCQDHPGIDVALTVGNREELLARFAANEDDLYILGSIPDTIDAEYKVFAENPLVLIAPPQHSLAKQTGLAPVVVVEEPFVMREKGSGTRIAAERFFLEQGIIPRVRLELGANEAIKQAVMAGLGLSVISRGAVRLELKHDYLREIQLVGFPIVRHWHVAWPKGKRLSVGALAFMDILLRPKEAGLNTIF